MQETRLHYEHMAGAKDMHRKRAATLESQVEHLQAENNDLRWQLNRQEVSAGSA